MALINCSNCGKDYSDLLSVCKHCKKRKEKKDMDKDNKLILKPKIMAESEIPDNQKTEDNSDTLSNYIIAILTSVIYVVAVHSIEILSNWGFFIPTVIIALAIPAIFASIYYLVKRKGFSKVFAWATVILCVISYFGQTLE